MFPVEIFQQTLSKLTTILQHHAIRFHLTGGLTGTVYGEPRMTQDIDVVVDPVQMTLVGESLLNSLEGSVFLFNPDVVRSAIRDGGMFQLLDQAEALKLDVYVREMIPGELSRSERVEVFEGQWLPVVSRVDAAISKLIWIGKGSHKSRRDLR
ncbi:MAG: hypothetical protein WD049_01955 [Candidatus Paceibacterota bacterium]